MHGMSSYVERHWPAQVIPVDPDINVRGAATSAHGSHLAAAAAVGWDLMKPLHFCHIQQLQVAVHALHNMTKMQGVAGSESVPCRHASKLLR